MKRTLKSKPARIISTIIIIAALIVTCVTNVFAFDTKALPSATMEADKSITFSNINNLDVGESIEINVTDKEGNPATIGIECIGYHNDISTDNSSSANRSSKEIKVYFTGVIINCSFYMTVSNNKCTRVYDDWILTVGGTYSNKSLTRTTTYGKLSFTFTDYLGIMSGTCWLKGTVTGSGNNVSVTYSM